MLLLTVPSWPSHVKSCDSFVISIMIMIQDSDEKYNISSKEQYIYDTWL